MCNLYTIFIQRRFYLYFLNLEFHIIVMIGILCNDYNLVKQLKIRSLIYNLQARLLGGIIWIFLLRK